MNIQQIRNATMRITLGNTTFLTDPWLADKGAAGSFRDWGGNQPLTASQAATAMPMKPLPCPRSAILSHVDACIITHLHPDHIDMDMARHTVGAPLPRHLPVFVQNEADAAVLAHSGFTDVRLLSPDPVTFSSVTLRRTPGRHGTGQPSGISSGVLFQTPGEKTLYLTGDTIWYDGTAQVVSTYQPDVIIANTGAATLQHCGRLIMDTGDLLAMHHAIPKARIIATHLDSVPHNLFTRHILQEQLELAGLSHAISIPADGETLTC